MKKKYLAGMAVVGLVALGHSIPAYADLVVSGAVEYNGAQRNLIYDTDLNITWLDYSNDQDTWQNQMTWAANLAVTVNGITYDNWRLPSTVDGPYVWGTDGTTTGGYYITTSEMGHLYYTELGNKGYYAMTGGTQTGYGLQNQGLFANLFGGNYWSGTEYSDYPEDAWRFHTGDGSQDPAGKVGVGYYPTFSLGLAVMPGQISSVPEPASMLLIGTGLSGLVGLKRRRK